jgi:hypothetical protein
MGRVIRPGNIFFKDDIKIIEPEIGRSLNIPKPLIFSEDELQIFYNGEVYALSETPVNEDYIKVYTRIFGLKKTDSFKKKEESYFSDNARSIEKLKEGFIEKVINGISVLDGKLQTSIPSSIASELVKKINEHYDSKKGPNKTAGFEKILLLDEKIYDLLTLPEFVAKFENSFEKNCYAKVLEKCKTESPEEISQMLLASKDKIHRKALPLVRNKIWHSNRSFKLFLGGTYFIPEYQGNRQALKDKYIESLERKIKVDSVTEYVR